MSKKNIFVSAVFLLFLVLLSLQVSATYIKSSVQGFSTTGVGGLASSGGQWVPDRTSCEAGQDFAVQIPPFGCEPAVVRSDLLEEQNVPIFCQLAATQMNPLLTVKAIDSISFSGQQLPKEISGVGFSPAQAALGVKGKLNSPVLENIGYAVIVLKKQPNASAIPDSVSGNLTATLKYNIEDAYGVGKTQFYLSEISDDSIWENSKSKFGFWNGKGYLRADSISPEGARVSIYADDKKLGTLSLDKGQTSNEIFLPGFDCFVGVKLKLEDLVAPNTRAILKINNDIIQLNEGEKFLDNKCTLKKVSSNGMTKKAEIYCKDDEGAKTFTLVLTPKVTLDISNIGKKDYNVGDYLYSAFVNDKQSYVYLGYIGTKQDSGMRDDLYVSLVSVPLYGGERMSENDITYYSNRAEGKYSSIYKDKALILQGAQKWGAAVLNAVKNLKLLFDDKEIKYIPYKKDEQEKEATNDFLEKTITIIDFSSPVNFAFGSGGAALSVYTSASQDYLKVFSSFSGEKIPSNEEFVLGEEALIEHIKLSYELRQKEDVKRLCEDFKKAYPNSKRYSDVISGINTICDNPSKQSDSASSSTKEVSINSVQKIISLEDIREPTFKEFGATVRVTYSDKSTKDFDLGKDKVVPINDVNPQDYVQLKSINGDTISMNVNRPRVTTTEKIASLYESATVTLKKDTSDSFGTAYSFRIVNIYEKKEAKVSVIPTVNRAQTEANFSFHIAIEQRAIKLSPEKTKEKIEDLNKTINDLTDINDKLTKVVEGMKGACLATGLALTIKNFANNVEGQSIARQQVMLGKGGWNEKCAGWVSSKTSDTPTKEIYRTSEECIMENADTIDKEVEALTGVIKTQDESLKAIQNDCKAPVQGFLFETVIDTKCLAEKYRVKVTEKIKVGTYKFMVKEEDKTQEVISLINQGKVSVQDMRDIERNIMIENTKELDILFLDVYNTYKQELLTINAAKSVGVDVTKVPHVSFGKEAAIVKDYTGLIFKDAQQNMNLCMNLGDDFCAVAQENTPVQYFTMDDGIMYFAILEQIGGRLHINSLYNANTKQLIPSEEKEKIKLKVNFQITNAESYKGRGYKSPVLRCYETEPYKNVPSIVPVDTKNGWYVSVSPYVVGFGSTSSVDASGRVVSYYLCNVWENGMEEGGVGKGDDKCTSINLVSGQALQVGGLNEADSKNLIKEATEAFQKSQEACKSGKSGPFNLGKNAQGIKMGAPAVSISSSSCTDFMSPNDCKILFNVCDPVICPSSRCNLGGKYPVKDVIQSGVIGSILLCLPNFGEVYIPVCLSGIKAGFDGYLSILKSYRGCLQENLESGKMVGICDEIYSIYLCEFFWKQTLPVAKMIIPKTIEWIMGKSVRGGGEYMSVQEAWNTAGQSADYFVQYYSAEAYAAFKARVIQEVTDKVCKTYLSASYPDGGKVTDSLTQASSPPQYHGRFSEITYTTATNPPISQYSVFYYIYAGENSRAYYQVYLTEGSESSYYQDTSMKYIVATGYIEQGASATEKKDFTAVSGYKKMCIVVNGKEPDCVFQNAMVSSSFALDWVADQYVKEQANQTGITSEKDCISGTSSAWSLATTSAEGAANELINPELYNRGIIRVCANEDPGKVTDKDSTKPRYVSVGYCGDRNLKCWLDTESVKNAVKFESSAQEVLENTNKNFLEKMKEEGKAFQKGEFEVESKKILKMIEESNFASAISYINSIMSKAVMNSEKGMLYLLRGNAYGNIAKIEGKKEIEGADKRAAEAEAARKKAAEDAASGKTPTTPPSCLDGDVLATSYYYSILGLNEKLKQEDSNYLKTNYYSNDWNKYFIDGIYGISEDEKRLQLIDKIEYDDITGLMAGSADKDIAYVKNLLFTKFKALCAKKGIAVTADLTQVPAEQEQEFQVFQDASVCYYDGRAGKSVILRTVRAHLNPYSSIISEASSKLGVKESMIGAIIEVESKGNAGVPSSSAGAKGLMQLMPNGAVADIHNGGCTSLCSKYYGENWATDPKTNIMMGTCYFKCLGDVYKIPEVYLRIAAYNAGPPAVTRYCKSGEDWKDFKDCETNFKTETRLYAPMVYTAEGCLRGVDVSKILSVDMNLNEIPSADKNSLENQISLKSSDDGKYKVSYLSNEGVLELISTDETCGKVWYTFVPAPADFSEKISIQVSMDLNGKIFSKKVPLSSFLSPKKYKYAAFACSKKGRSWINFFASEGTNTIFVGPFDIPFASQSNLCNSKQGNYYSAIMEGKSLDQFLRPKDNVAIEMFVEKIKKQELITLEDYNNFMGKDIFGVIGFEENMQEILSILNQRYKEACGSEVTLFVPEAFDTGVYAMDKNGNQYPAYNLNLKAGPFFCDAVKYNLKGNALQKDVIGIISQNTNGFFETKLSVPKDRVNYQMTVQCYNPTTKKTEGRVYDSNSVVFPKS